MKSITWLELKQFANEIIESELHGLVMVENEECLLPILGLEVVSEDIYCCIDDPEDCGTLKELQEIHGKGFDIDDYLISMHKGYTYLSSVRKKNNSDYSERLKEAIKYAKELFDDGSMIKWREAAEIAAEEKDVMFSDVLESK